MVRGDHGHALLNGVQQSLTDGQCMWRLGCHVAHNNVYTAQYGLFDKFSITHHQQRKFNILRLGCFYDLLVTLDGVRYDNGTYLFSAFVRPRAFLELRLLILIC